MDAVMAGAEKQGRATATLSTLYPLSSGPDGLEAAVKALCAEAEARVRAGEAEILVLSDREAPADGAGGDAATRAAAAGRTAEMTFIPPMIAVGAVHHHLIQVGLRMDTSIIAETAQAWSTHHMNCLVGYGAHAVHPYLLWRAVRHHYELGKTSKMRAEGKLPDISLEEAYANTRNALEAGMLKILSKIGICLLSSYHGAQIFLWHYLL